MLIVCPNCATSYRVEPASLGAAGRSVRCVRCRSVWFAHDSSAMQAVTEAFRNDLAEANVGAADEQAELPAEAAPSIAAEAEPVSEEAVEAPLADEVPVDEMPPEGEQPLTPTLPEHGMLRPYEPVAMADAPTLSTGPEAIVPLADATVGGDIETMAALKAKRRGRKLWLPAPGLPATIMALIVIIAILIGWRTDVVRMMPQTASLFAAIGLPVNLRGLAFSDVTTTTEAHDGVTMLVVQGTITNITKPPRDVPRIRLAMKTDAGPEVYSWTSLPSRVALAPGDSEPFQTRLASPPLEGHHLEVRFFHKRDLTRGGR